MDGRINQISFSSQRLFHPKQQGLPCSICSPRTKCEINNEKACWLSGGLQRQSNPTAKRAILQVFRLYTLKNGPIGRIALI